jgi:hypothetical protein
MSEQKHSLTSTMLGKMPNLMNLPGSIRIDSILESAVQACWTELMPAADAGAIQIEHGAQSDDSLQYLKFWSSTKRGHWELICEQWFTAAWAHLPGLQFFGGHHSENFGRALEAVARSQSAFAKGSGQGRGGFILVTPPTEDERQAAEIRIAEIVSSTARAESSAQREAA